MLEARVKVAICSITLFLFSCNGGYNGFIGMSACSKDPGSSNGERSYYFFSLMITFVLVFFFMWFCVESIKAVNHTLNGEETWIRQLRTVTGCFWQQLQTPQAQGIIGLNPLARRTYNQVQLGHEIIENILQLVDAIRDPVQAGFNPQLAIGDAGVAVLEAPAAEYGTNNPFANDV